MAPASAETAPARVFISYKRHVTPDEPLALELWQALSAHYAPFIDQKNIMPSQRWGEAITTALQQMDMFIVLLSEESTHSDMVIEEVATAYRLARQHHTRPLLLPVRVAYPEPLPYPLSSYLNPVQAAFWDSAADTPGLLDTVRRVIAGETMPSSPPPGPQATLRTLGTPVIPRPLPLAQLEIPGGNLDPQSAFYIERPEDHAALREVQRQGFTMTIQAPRQMGKSSLLVRVLDVASQRGKQGVWLDFQQFEAATLENADLFFPQFCFLLTDALGVPDQISTYWQVPLGNVQRCTRYVQRHLLPALGQPVLLAMDEVESLIDSPFRSDFFGMLRSWHNGRAIQPIWKRLDLALVLSTEPHQLIANLSQSPFNVGETIALRDFTPEQVAVLNQRHGPALTPQDEQRLVELVGGHPYLVRRALYEVASQRLAAADLFAQATQEQSPFSDHLRYHLFRLHSRQDLMEGMRQVLRQQTCADEQVCFRLLSAGLVRREGNTVLPRCRLYADYFQERLRA